MFLLLLTFCVFSSNEVFERGYVAGSTQEQSMDESSNAFTLEESVHDKLCQFLEKLNAKPELCKSKAYWPNKILHKFPTYLEEQLHKQLNQFQFKSTIQLNLLVQNLLNHNVNEQETEKFNLKFEISAKYRTHTRETLIAMFDAYHDLVFAVNGLDLQQVTYLDIQVEISYLALITKKKGLKKKLNEFKLSNFDNMKDLLQKSTMLIKSLNLNFEFGNNQRLKYIIASTDEKYLQQLQTKRLKRTHK
eukprot:NODE_121_length_17861_cov_0.498480.p7 type:complete len:247 gc:universal NODE_121_length_17861_cov_0.498480:6296-5556(-)